MFRAKIDFMHYNPLVYATEGAPSPTHCSTLPDLFTILLLIWVFQRLMQVFKILTWIQDQGSSICSRWVVLEMGACNEKQGFAGTG